MKIFVVIISMIFISSCAAPSTRKQPEPFVDEVTPEMRTAITMQFTSIPLEESIKLLGEFVGYEVLRPNEADTTLPIAFKFENTPWITAFKEICVNNNLRCNIRNKTIYFAPESYLKDKSFPILEGQCK